ncbi:MAG: hypothetical protein ACM3WU_01770 [Bacillota bacterium]
MGFLKGVLLTVSAIIFFVAVTTLGLSYSLLSSASPSSVLQLAEEFGGTDVVVGDILEIIVDPMPEDFARREKIIEAVKATLSTEKVSDLVDQAISSIRAYIGSAGQDSVTIDLRGLKASFLNHLRASYDGSIEDIELDLQEMPDRADVSRFISMEDAKELAGPYRIFANLPLISAGVAVACVLLLLNCGGVGPGLRLAGLLALMASALLLGGSPTAKARVTGLIPDALSGPTLPVPIPVDPPALLIAATGLVLARVRLSAAVLAIIGAAMATAPRLIGERSAQEKRPSTPA